MDKDDSVKMLAESIVKIESVKEESDDNLETSDWDFTVLSDSDTFKNAIKEEDNDEDELEPPVTVFVEPAEVMEEEIVKEYEDPLSWSDNLSNVVFEKEESPSSPNTGGECPTRTTSRKMPVGHIVEQNHGGDCCKRFCEREILPSLLTNPHEKPSSEKCATNTSSILPTKNIMDDGLSLECNICQKKFTRKRSVISHMRHHTRNNTYKCTICQENFKGSINLVKHMQIHTREGLHECIECKRHFARISDVVRHMKYCPGLYCLVCKKKFTDRAEVVGHMASHTKENFHCCSVCQKNFNERRQLISHTLIAHPKSEYCSVCQVSIKDGETLERHMRVHFGKKFYECSICLETFKRKDTLAMHMLFHSEETRHKCCICQKGFRRRKHLLQHLQTRVHMKTIALLNVDTRQHCYICKKTSKTRGHLRQHMCAQARKIHNKSLTNGVELVGPTSSHPGEYLHHCSVSQKNIKSKELILHMQDHTQPHQCSMCEIKFENTATLTWHMCIYCREELYGCPICQRSFAVRESFVMHMQVHMIERQFECVICEESFSTKGDLLTHLQVHVGVRKNECAICQRTFSCFTEWHSHLQIHIRERCYECSVCQKGFADRRTLFEHVWKHVEVKKWVCSNCQKSFKHTSVVNYHLTHSEDEHLKAQSVNNVMEKLAV